MTMVNSGLKGLNKQANIDCEQSQYLIYRPETVTVAEYDSLLSRGLTALHL